MRPMALIGVAALTGAALATDPPVLTVHDISPGSANPLLSGNNVGLDVLVSGLHGPPDPTGGGWLVGGVSGHASHGSFRYAFDPNDHVVIAGTHAYDPSDQVTMVSRPRGQTQGSRFKTGGNGSANLILPGGYDPGTAFSSTDADFVNVSFAGADEFNETTDGYTTRVVVDMTASGIDPLDVYAIAGAAPTHPNDVLIATGKAGAGAVGHPDPLAPENTVLWSLFAVPEPASLALVLVGVLAAIRRR